MWRLSLRDLQWRRRRFIIAVFATAIVFAMTLLMSGITSGMRAENRTIVERFNADAWLVAKGTSGPFTASTVIPAAAGPHRRAQSGRRRSRVTPYPTSARTSASPTSPSCCATPPTPDREQG
ncbi:MAG: hypothetical protein ACXVKA_00410 [Acidimicrobiia bacterium]